MYGHNYWMQCRGKHFCKVVVYRHNFKSHRHNFKSTPKSHSVGSSSYLLCSQGLVGVVELINQDLSIAGERRVPAEGHRGGGVGDCL